MFTACIAQPTRRVSAHKRLLGTVLAIAMFAALPGCKTTGGADSARMATLMSSRDSLATVVVNLYQREGEKTTDVIPRVIETRPSPPTIKEWTAAHSNPSEDNLLKEIEWLRTLIDEAVVADNGDR